MNNLQPYEKHLADKLRQVPVPDKDAGWEQMRRLLDREGSEGGAGWSGNRRWWWMGITVALIITGAWLSQYFSEQSTTDPLTAKNAQSKISSPTPNTSNNKNNSTYPADNTQSPGKNIPVDESSGDAATSSTASNRKEPDAVKKDVPDATATPAKNIAAGVSTGTTVKTSDQKKQNGLQDTKAVLSVKTEKQSDKTMEQMSQQRSSVKNNKLTRNDLSYVGDKSNASNGVDEKIIPPAIAVSDDAAKTDVIINEADSKEQMLSGRIIGKNLSDAGSMFSDPAQAFNDMNEMETPLIAIPGKTDRAFRKEMRQKSMKDDNRRISGRSMRGNFGEKDHELTFAAGLALPQSFAVGNQQTSSYGVNAKTGRLGDYLPVPYFQYHLNSRLFLQTELHFQSPQYTNRLLVSYSMTTQQTNVQEKSAYVEKLYYFNVPFNIYFSPARNFYIGGGLQYSSLLSGVATFNERLSSGGATLSSSSKVQRFKDDSLAARLSPSEWRYQFDASYGLNRFTLGLRYNQAMKDFVNLYTGGPIPLTQARNKAFLLYLRYNIWEERKK